jgi:hypothetical protein
MKRIDRVGAVVCFVLAGFVFWQSASIPRGNLSQPGPGFMPFWVASILALLSGILWITAEGQKSASMPVQFLAGEGRWPGVVFTALSLFGYAFLLEVMGFIFSTFLLQLFLFRFIGKQKWWIVLTGSVVVTLAAHALFKVALKVQLPSGFF